MVAINLTFIRKWRAYALVIFLFPINISTTFAHSLPGSVLKFSQFPENNQHVDLTLSFALDDLLIASPAFEKIQSYDINEDLNLKDFRLLEEYLNQHLQLYKDTERLSLTLKHVALELAFHEDIGEYIVLVSTLSSDKAIYGDVLPLTLQYDAIMHEIRNHRAMVYWLGSNEELMKLSNFGFKKVDGKQQKVSLQTHN